MQLPNLILEGINLHHRFLQIQAVFALLATCTVQVTGTAALHTHKMEQCGGFPRTLHESYVYAYVYFYAHPNYTQIECILENEDIFC